MLIIQNQVIHDSTGKNILKFYHTHTQPLVTFGERPFRYSVYALEDERMARIIGKMGSHDLLHFRKA